MGIRDSLKIEGRAKTFYYVASVTAAYRKALDQYLSLIHILRYAINYGADAVYCSLPEFGMRSAPATFTPEQLAEGVIYAHARGRKVYLTMNTDVYKRQVHDFNGYREHQFDLLGKSTVLFGVNGAGKSTVPVSYTHLYGHTAILHCCPVKVLCTHTWQY